MVKIQDTYLYEQLSKEHKREIMDVREAAEKRLPQIDINFTDHTVAHSDRILNILNILLKEWVKTQFERGWPGLEDEIFILLASIYLHDIGMNYLKFRNCPRLMEEKGSEIETNMVEDSVISKTTLNFVRRNHHIISYDWIKGSITQKDKFCGLGLKSYHDSIAKVAWAHGFSIEPKNMKYFENELKIKKFDNKKIRLLTISSFLRLGDILDINRNRVDIQKLKQYTIDSISEAHWWRHHYINTFIPNKIKDEYDRYPLDILFTLPIEHKKDEYEWLPKELYNSLRSEILDEQNRIKHWLLNVQIVFPNYEENRDYYEYDDSGDLEPIPPGSEENFRAIWNKEAINSDKSIKEKIDDNNLSTDDLIKYNKLLNIRKEIANYHKSIKNEEFGFKMNNYSVLELSPAIDKNGLDILENKLKEYHQTRDPFIILGEPGAGKTTLVKKFMLDCSMNIRLIDYIPFYVQVSDFGSSAGLKELNTELERKTDARCLDEELYPIYNALLRKLLILIGRSFCNLANIPYSNDELIISITLDIFSKRACIIFFDGLNELSNDNKGLLIFAIKQFIKEYQNVKVVITSRIGDYSDLYFPNAPSFKVMELRKETIREYFQKIGVTDAKINVLENENKSFFNLASNPMYMFMLGEVMKKDQELKLKFPGQLYKEFTTSTLKKWETKKQNRLLSKDEMNILFASLAFEALNKQEISFTNNTVTQGIKNWQRALNTKENQAIFNKLETNNIEFNRLKNINHIVENGRKETLNEELLNQHLTEEMVTTGFLIKYGEESNPQYRFKHHTIQEYFAALYISTNLDVLQDIVGKPVFHESLKFVVNIIENPCGFIKELLASTSKTVSRNSILRLCFKVAGASPSPLDKAAQDILFSSVKKMYIYLHKTHIPFALELLAVLFSYLKREYLVSFMEYLLVDKQIEKYETKIISLIKDKLVTALKLEEPINKDKLKDFFNPGINDGTIRDYDYCKSILEEFAEANIFETHSLLLSGLVSSFSLSVSERKRIARKMSTLTPNQIGGLEMIFLDEHSKYAEYLDDPLNLRDIVRLHQLHISSLICYEIDEDFLNGNISEAFIQWTKKIDKVYNNHNIIARLIKQSKHIPDELYEQIREKICVWNCEPGQLIAPFDDERSYEFSQICQETEYNVNLQKEIIECLEKDEVRNPWTLLFYGSLFETDLLNTNLPQIIEEYNPENWLLDLFYSAAVQYATTENRELIYAKYPDIKINKSKDLITKLIESKDKIDDILNEFIQLEVNSYSMRVLIRQIYKKYPINDIKKLIEDLEPFDKYLSEKAKLYYVDLLANSQKDQDVLFLMSEWKITVREIETSNKSLLKCCAKNNMFEEVVSYLKNVKALDLLIEIFLQAEKRNDAIKIALDALENNSGKYVSECYRMIKEIDDPEQKKGYFEELSLKLFSLLNNFTDRENAFKYLRYIYNEKMIDKNHYLEEIEEVLSRRFTIPFYSLLRHYMHLCSDEEINIEKLKNMFPYYMENEPKKPLDKKIWLGNGGWYAYLLGDNKKALNLTEEALEIEGEKSIALICNKAFLSYLRDKNIEESLNIYREAISLVKNKEAWNTCAIIDLEKHGERRNEAAINKAYIDKVRELYDAKNEEEAKET